jgi:hypothetical protein
MEVDPSRRWFQPEASSRELQSSCHRHVRTLTQQRNHHARIPHNAVR